MGMTLHLNNPELQAKVDQWVNDTGRRLKNWWRMP